MLKPLAAATALFCFMSIHAQADIKYPPEGKIPTDITNPTKDFYHGDPVEESQFLIVYHAPELNGYVNWGANNEDAKDKTSNWYREEARERAFLRFSFPNFDYISFTDDAFLETDNYILTKRTPTLSDGAPRHRTIEVIRLWGNSVCDAAAKKCPWFIAAIDARDPARPDVLNHEIVDHEDDDAAVRYQFGLRSGDSTTINTYQSLDECDTVEPEYGVKINAKAPLRKPATFLNNEKPKPVYPGLLVKIADDMKSVSICGHTHPISWTRTIKP